jgi:HD-GYP domain-containing protein (c-di-GMP phosphodiesterase class II)
MNDNIKELEQTIDELGDMLAKNFFQTTQVLASMLSFTERYYEGSHSRFVAEKSAYLARELAFNEEDVMEVRIAGLLHDIGKVGFSDSTLYKYPSEMTPSEGKSSNLFF